MYAIVEIAGQQFKVEKDQEIFVHRLEGEAGSAVAFDNVMLLDNDGKVTVGTPTIDGAQVKAKIIEHLKGDKVIVFHKKRRKGYQKQNGHRQYFSKLVIEDLIATGAKKVEKKETVKATPKAEAKKEAKPKAPAKPKAAPKKVAEAKAEKPAAAPKKETKPKAKKKETVAKKAVKAAPKAEAKKEAKPKAPAKPKAEKKAEPKAKEKKEDTK